MRCCVWQFYKHWVKFNNWEQNARSPLHTTNLRAVPVVEGRLVTRPAALFPVEPERLGTDPELEVCHPRGADVDDSSYHPGTHSHQQHAHPSWPRVVCALKWSSNWYTVCEWATIVANVFIMRFNSRRSFTTWKTFKLFKLDHACYK